MTPPIFDTSPEGIERQLRCVEMYLISQISGKKPQMLERILDALKKVKNEIDNGVAANLRTFQA